jgi:chemotaxis protein MotB
MISAGVRQLEFLDNYYNEMANSAAEDTEEQTEGKQSVTQAYEEQALAESEEMAEQIQSAINSSGLGDEVEIDFNAEYVQLNLSGAILFESGKADLISGAIPIIDKVGKILEQYDQNIIEVEGHTDNVPIHSDKFANNEVLSMYRALAVTERLREKTSINPKYLKFAGRGDYVPIADNNTAEGRARNRRVEIKVYNSYNSNLGE